MRVGVIGLGFGGKVVAPAFERTEGCDVVGVVSPRDEAAVATLCSRDDVDLISVHSPPFLHLEHVRRAVEAGHDVLCDKPFGRNAEEAEEMHRLATAAGVVHLLNFENRFDPARQALRRAIGDGSIGDPEHVVMTMLMSGSRTPLRRYGWLFDAGSAGGWLRAMGSHQIDFARWTFGELVEVHGQLRTAVTERPDTDGTMHECTADDGFVLAMRTDRDVSVVIDSSSAAPLIGPLSLLVLGSQGTVEDAGGRVVVRTADGEREVFRSEPGNPLVTAMNAYAELVRDAVHSREVPADVPTFADGLACSVVIDRADPPRD